jgi:coenzyme PQQ precursor peptide PqqA
MKWKTPVIVEIAVGLEINAYACAEVLWGPCSVG